MAAAAASAESRDDLAKLQRFLSVGGAGAGEARQSWSFLPPPSKLRNHRAALPIPGIRSRQERLRAGARSKPSDTELQQKQLKC